MREAELMSALQCGIRYNSTRVVAVPLSLKQHCYAITLHLLLPACAANAMQCADGFVLYRALVNSVWPNTTLRESSKLRNYNSTYAGGDKPKQKLLSDCIACACKDVDMIF